MKRYILLALISLNFSSAYCSVSISRCELCYPVTAKIKFTSEQWLEDVRQFQIPEEIRLEASRACPIDKEEKLMLLDVFQHQNKFRLMELRNTVFEKQECTEEQKNQCMVRLEQTQHIIHNYLEKLKNPDDSRDLINEHINITPEIYLAIITSMKNTSLSINASRLNIATIISPPPLSIAPISQEEASFANSLKRGLKNVQKDEPALKKIKEDPGLDPCHLSG